MFTSEQMLFIMPLRCGTKNRQITQMESGTKVSRCVCLCLWLGDFLLNGHTAVCNDGNMDMGMALVYSMRICLRVTELHT